MFFKPKFEVGDIVYDCIGIVPEKREVTQVDERGLFEKPLYYLRNLGAEYKSMELRHESYLKLVMTADEYKTQETLRRLEAERDKRMAGIRADVERGVEDAVLERKLPKGKTSVAHLREDATLKGKDFPKGWAMVVERIGKDRIAAHTEYGGGRNLIFNYESFRHYFTFDKPQEPEEDWFDVVCMEPYEYFCDTGVKLVKGGEVISACEKRAGAYKVRHEGITVHTNATKFAEHFERYDINDYATEWPRKKEEKAMDYDAGALHGYPPEEPSQVAEVQQRAHAEITKRDTKIAEERARVKALQAQLEEQAQKNEVARREQVAEEFGIVAERHLWDVVIEVPMSWSPRKPFGSTDDQRATEILTENRNMVEAGMAAEAMAKGIHEDAHVVKIMYSRNVGAIK